MSKSHTKMTNKTGNMAKAPMPEKKSTKADAIIKLLRSKKGASLEDMQKATGWQVHSVRGFISGTVKKRMGLTVQNETGKDGLKRYRIEQDAVIQ